ncbi:MAG TPA: hypothetical protein VK433_05255 [Stellaceae bacterium]|nr:hypothetical protein [Stellaceae bacterium]
MPPKGGSKSGSGGGNTETGATASGDAAKTNEMTAMTPVLAPPAGASTHPTALPPQDPRFPVFYRSLTAIDAGRHGGKSLRQRLGFNFARGSHAVLLNGTEFEVRHGTIPSSSRPRRNRRRWSCWGSGAKRT